ncbi:MAG: hypothetical protein J0M15_16095 [Deltaproteobacteria bacterium]|jgi:hypothetical protein|nr:hypothetical protein [Deltaproteobacteria bacterium]
MHFNLKRILLVVFFPLFTPDISQSQVVEKIILTEEEVRQQMIVISRQLGVTCTECHVLNNFSDSLKKSYQISKKHFKIVELLKLNGLSGTNGEPEASCFTCHKGQLKFPHKESLNDHNRHDTLLKKKTKEKEEIVSEKPQE